jgi:hypothetical protein
MAQYAQMEREIVGLRQGLMNAHFLAVAVIKESGGSVVVKDETVQALDFGKIELKVDVVEGGRRYSVVEKVAEPDKTKEVTLT